VLFELTAGQLGSMPSTSSTLPAEKEAEPEEDIDDEMLNRLAGLRSA